MSPTYKAPMYSPGRPMNRPPMDEVPLGRTHRYRELQLPHRAPYYEDTEKRRSRPMREVIVQKADQWSDPWMRSKSPGGRKRGSTKRERRSYSSNSSYSSSRYTAFTYLRSALQLDIFITHYSSSNSDSSSESTSPSTKHRRFSRHKSKESSKSLGLRKRMRTRSPTPKQQYSPGTL